MKIDNEKYSKLLNLIDTEFSRNKILHGEKIKCDKGCSKCCYQNFRITGIDAKIIADHINSLCEEDMKILTTKAFEYLESKDKLSKPCPALSPDGVCTIYEARPVVCRRFGPPMYDYKTPDRIHSCELNFSEGEEIIDEDLIERQTEIGKTWDELKLEFNRGDKTFLIAEAIYNYKELIK